MREIATTAATQLDCRHGDPSRAASWMRERRLAWFVLALLERAERVGSPVEIKE